VTAPPPLVRAQGLTRRYGDFTALSGLDLEVFPGELFGFLGPNGAGKTTTLRLLTGLLLPSEGEAFVAGHSLTRAPAAARARLGFVPETPFLYDRLTAREFLALCAALYDVPQDVARRRAAALLALLELTPAADALIDGYSHGMRQKAALAGALVHDPDVLFLDEPTVGLDPRSARVVKDLLRALCARGKTVFLSTHVLEIAERLCDRVGILHRGRLVALGAVGELRERARGVQSLEEIFLDLTGGGAPEAELKAFLDEIPPTPAAPPSAAPRSPVR
jgi:ABC-2 type transport system ATP-binding protein